MTLKMKRRVVYATMGLTVLALVGGFAMAALTNSVTSGGQNGYAVSAPTNTMYSGGTQTTTLVMAKAAACESTGETVAPASGVTVAYINVTGEVACQTSTADWFEEITFTSTAVPSATPSDVFAITVSTNSPISVTVTFAGLSSGSSTVTVHIFYELGGSATPVVSDIGITGS